MKLFDAHCHIQDGRFAADIEAVLKRACDRGVERLACCATAEADWYTLLSIADRYSCVVPSFGIHPWYTGGLCDGWSERLMSLLASNPCAGVGEIGLDHALDPVTHEKQAGVFTRQIEIAREMGRPMSLHCRRAWGAVMDTLKRFGNFPDGFVVHSYSGSVEVVQEIVGLGGYISFSGTVTRSGNKRAHNAVPAVPEDRLLVETDAPDMIPVFRDESEQQLQALLMEDRNEPCTLAVAVKSLAALRKTGVEDIARITFENGERLFGKERLEI